jgi:hypothetical protein
MFVAFEIEFLGPPLAAPRDFRDHVIGVLRNRPAAGEWQQNFRDFRDHVIAVCPPLHAISECVSCISPISAITVFLTFGAEPLSAFPRSAIYSPLASDNLHDFRDHVPPSLHRRRTIRISAITRAASAEPSVPRRHFRDHVIAAPLKSERLLGVAFRSCAASALSIGACGSNRTSIRRAFARRSLPEARSDYAKHLHRCLRHL